MSQLGWLVPAWAISCSRCYLEASNGLGEQPGVCSYQKMWKNPWKSMVNRCVICLWWVWSHGFSPKHVTVMAMFGIPKRQRRQADYFLKELALGEYTMPVPWRKWEEMYPIWSSKRRCLTTFPTKFVCLLVGDLEYFFSYIRNNHPNWLIFFKMVKTTNQSVYVAKVCRWGCAYAPSPQGLIGWYVAHVDSEDDKTLSLPSGSVFYHSYWTWQFIVDWPIENGDFP